MKRLPKYFRMLLPENYRDYWIKTEVSHDGFTYVVAALFDTNYIFIALERGKSISYSQIEYKDIASFDTFQNVVYRAVAFSFMNGFLFNQEEFPVKDDLETLDIKDIRNFWN